MKEYTNYILKTLTVLDAFFEELDKLFKEIRTTGLQMRFDDSVDAETYYKFMKDTFDKVSETICPTCHTLEAAIAITREFESRFDEDSRPPILDYVMANLFEHSKKYSLHTELYEAYKDFYNEAIEFFNGINKQNEFEL